MSDTVAKELTQPVSVSPDANCVFMALTDAEVLIVRWYRGDRSITPAMLEAALALAAGRAKPGP